MSDGSRMRHSSTQQLHAYWLRQRGNGPAPIRSTIEPAHIPGLLGDMFILDAAVGGTLPFRLAGTRLCANLGRELTGEDFLSLWQGADRDTIAMAAARVAHEAAVAIVEIAGRSDRGNTLALEMLLLPVSQDGRKQDRILGMIAPLERPYWLGLHAITHRPIQNIHWLPQDASLSPNDTPVSRTLPAEPRISTEPSPSPRQASASPEQPDGRRHRHLVVLNGGRD